jgi:hypothetical protein
VTSIISIPVLTSSSSTDFKIPAAEHAIIGAPKEARQMKRIVVILGLGAAQLLEPSAWALQEGEAGREGYKGILGQILAFIYTIAHGIGQLVVRAIQLVLPHEASVLNSLIDPIGVLALLTIFLAVAEVAKKITWIIVVVGWALIVIRIVLVAFKIG